MGAVHAAPAYHAPVVHAAPAYHAPVAHAGYVADDLSEVSPYSYTYAVADDYSGAAFNQAENNDGAGVVDGEYSVNLPDGRIQHVKYHANDYDGYVADVTYEGTPTYGAAPVAHAAPAYHAPVVAHAAPVVAHAVHAAPVVAHAVHAPVAHAVHAAPVVHAAHAVHAPVVAHPVAHAVHAAPVVAHSVHAAPVVAPVVVKAAPAYHAPAPAYKAEEYPDEVSPYTYTYAVADDYSKSNFNAEEQSDGAS